MKLSIVIPALLTSGLIFLNGCAGGSHGAGYWFHFIFVIIPLCVIGFLLLKRTDALNESVNTIEDQLKKLSSKLDNLEERMKKTRNTKKEEETTK